MSTITANIIVSAIDRASPVLRRVASGAAAQSAAFTSAARGARSLGYSMMGPGSFGAIFASGALLSGMASFDKAMRQAQATAFVLKDEAYEPVRQEVQRLAKTYPAYAKQIAAAVVELHMAGLQMSDVLARNAKGATVLEQVVQGAMATQESFATVAKGVTDVVMAMALPWDTAADKVKSFQRVNDVLAVGISAANQNYQEFLNTLSYSAPVARAVGTDLETLVALAGALANSGIKASKAGTGLRAMFIRPLKLSDKKLAVLQKYRIEMEQFTKAGKLVRSGKNLADYLTTTTGVNVKPLAGVLDPLLNDPMLARNAGVLGDRIMEVLGSELGIAAGDAQKRKIINEAVRDYVTAGYSQLDLVGLLRTMAERNVSPGDAAEIFGLRHIPKALSLMEQLLSDKFQKVYDRIVAEQAGAASKKAEIQMRGTLGALYRMASAFDVVSKQIMEKSGAWGDLGAVFDGVTDYVTRLAETNPMMLKFGLFSLFALGVLAPLGFIIAGISGALIPLATALGAIGALFGGGLLTGFAVMALGATALWGAWDGLVQALSGGGDVIAGVLTGDWARAEVGAWNVLEGSINAVTGALQAMGDVATWAFSLIDSALGTNIVETQGKIGSFVSDAFKRADDFVWNDLPRAIADTIGAGGLGSMPVEKGGTSVPTAGKAPMMRDIAPGMGPAEVNVKGEAELSVFGQVSGAIKNHILVEVEGPGRVKDQRSSGGTISGELNTGRTNIDLGSGQ